MKKIMRALVALSLLIAGIGVGSAGASQGSGRGPDNQRPADARSEHQRIVDFWTVGRVQQAIPRDFLFDPASGRFIPTAPGGVKGKPGGGGGGGGGGSGETAITGAHWTDGGVVVESTGKVLFSLSNVLYVCSASVVNDDNTPGRSLAVTAAHCVYENAGTGEFAQNWMYVPNYEASDTNLSITDGSFCATTLYGCWTASALVVHDGFAGAGGFNGTAIQYDFAFAVLETGSNGSALDSYGEQDIAFESVSKGTFAYDFGYPHRDSNGNLILELRYCAGKAGFDNRFFKLTYKLTCDMTGGSSGGPWLSSFDATAGTGTVMSVNSYRYNGGDALYGPKFNANTAAIFAGAKTATVNCLIGPTSGSGCP